MDFEFFRAVLLPFFAGCASLLIALLSRNTAISERLRASCADLIADVDHTRSTTLVGQLSVLRRRFIFNKLAITFVFFSMGFFTAMLVFAAWARGSEPPDYRLSIISFWGGIVSISMAFVFVIADIWGAVYSLGYEIEYAKNKHEERDIEHQLKKREEIVTSDE